MNKKAIVVAGGSGKRMESAIPKQFMLLDNKPVLMHTISRFYDYDSQMPIILVLPENEIETWNNLRREYNFQLPHEIVKGGQERYQSVKNALDTINDHCIVAIHDGVRPLVSKELIRKCFAEAEKHYNAVPAIPVSETLRTLDGPADRNNFRLIQTPQCFDSVMLKNAYNKNGIGNFTDDAGVFENDGNEIYLVEGEKFNVKITVKEDLVFADAILSSSSLKPKA